MPCSTTGKQWLRLDTEKVLWLLLVVLAVVTRFYLLDARVISHDESLHTYYSWELFKGKGYQHNPMMHGPFQFHALALSYLLFGDSDFSARIPASLGRGCGAALSVLSPVVWQNRCLPSRAIRADIAVFTILYALCAQ